MLRMRPYAVGVLAAAGTVAMTSVAHSGCSAARRNSVAGCTQQQTVSLVAHSSTHSCVQMPVWSPSILANCEEGQNRVLPHYFLQFKDQFDPSPLYSVVLTICTARFYVHKSYSSPAAHLRASSNASVQTPTLYVNYFLQLFSTMQFL